jgi:hypothetical protein
MKYILLDFVKALGSKFYLYINAYSIVTRHYIIIVLIAIGLSPGGSSPTLVQTKIKIHKTTITTKKTTKYKKHKTTK